MATRTHSRRRHATVDGEPGPLVAAYLRAAEEGRALSPFAEPYTQAALRRLRAALLTIEAHAGPLDAGTLAAADDVALEELARRVVERAGMPDGAVDTLASALRSVAGFVVGERRRSLRAVPPLYGDPPEARPAAPSPTPTFAMLALGTRVGSWLERIVVIAFVLAVIGLAFELA